MIKTTQEQRDRLKLKRRFGAWRDLLAKYHHRLRRAGTQRSLEIGYKALAAIERSGFADQIQNQIRAAN